MAVTNPYQQYKKNQIDTADQGKLIVMLYDGAIRFVSKAIELIETPKAKDIETIHNSIVRAQDIIAELMSSLNMDVGEISQRLLSIYMYMNTKLIEANIHKKKEPLEEVRKHLTELRDAWEQAAKTATPAEKTQSGGGGINIAT